MSSASYPAPGYGSRSLADLLPSLAATLSVPGFTDVLALGAARSAVLLLVDGLGATLLDEHAEAAPVLSGLAEGRSLDAGFPASTSISVASIATGLPPGAHGVVGLSMAYEGRALDTLKWTMDGVDAGELAVPEQVQPRPTVFERAAAAGTRSVVVSSHLFRNSSLTRAALRGAEYWSTVGHGDVAAGILEAISVPGTLCYAYVSELDSVGHLRGPGSTAWQFQLREIDRLVEMIDDRLPAGTVLAVTGDHGMVTLDQSLAVDFDERPELRAGVDLVTGEPRVRYLHVPAGAVADVRATWTATLGEGYLVVSRDEAIAAGWFGPEVTTDAASRIGDLVVVATGLGGVLRRTAEPNLSNLEGQHGSSTDAERRVALAVAR